MINNIHRFHGYNSLRFVYRQGKTSRGPLFALKALSNPRRSHYRLAIVVSRKVSKSAVVRNRIRRRLYEIVRGLEPEISGPYDIVLSVFHDTIANEDSKVLKNQLKKQLREVGALGSGR